MGIFTFKEKSEKISFSILFVNFSFFFSFTLFHFFLGIFLSMCSDSEKSFQEKEGCEMPKKSDTQF